jgi:Icc-related predicted phosphoesterase
MRLHLMSDLHLDHEADDGQAFMDNLKPQPEVDVLVLAGDWYSRCWAEGTQKLYSRLLECYDQVLVVSGNHEHWGANIAQAQAAMASGTPRIHVCLEPQYVTLKGQRFFAGTLWYRRPTKNQVQNFVDMQVIKTPKGWFFQQQKLFQEGLYQSQGLEDTIVVSHHLPSPKSTPAVYNYSPVNHFFVCNLTKAIKELKPKLWLHGHTHEPCDYAVGSTRIVANPRGYTWEHKQRPPYVAKLIEV